MRGPRQSWLERALGATTWLFVVCAAGACTGPGLEPPGDRSESGDAGRDAGDDLGSSGSAASGGAGSGGSGGLPTTDPGDGDGDSTDGDAGEASPDAGVEDDGGTDPEDLES